MFLPVALKTGQGKVRRPVRTTSRYGRHMLDLASTVQRHTTIAAAVVERQPDSGNVVIGITASCGCVLRLPPSNARNHLFRGFFIMACRVRAHAGPADLAEGNTAGLLFRLTEVLPCQWIDLPALVAPLGLWRVHALPHSAQCQVNRRALARPSEERALFNFLLDLFMKCGHK